MVDVLRDRIDLPLQDLDVFRQVFGREGLIGKAHVHDARRVALGGSQVDEAAFAEHVDPAVVLQGVLFDELPDLPLLLRDPPQSVKVQLDVEVTRVGDDGAVLHHEEMFPADHVDVPRERAEEIPDLRRLVDGHDAVAVHHGFQGLQGVHLRHHDARPQSVGPHRQPAGTPAVSADDEDRTRHEAVRRPDDPVDRALARSVTVVEQVFRLSVVDGDDGKPQHAPPGHGPQPDHPRRRLLGASHDAPDEVFSLRVDHRDEIGAVVHGQVGLHIEDGVDVPVVGLGVLPLDRVDGNGVVFHEVGGHVVLRAQGVRRAEPHLGPPRLERFHQACRLRRDVEAGPQAKPPEGLFLREAFADERQHRHAPVGPLDGQPARLRQCHVLDVVIHAVPFPVPAPRRWPEFLPSPG